MNEDFNKDFGMFSNAGNEAVSDIAEAAKFHNHSWAWAYAQLCELARQDGFGEATDTMVREIVYCWIGADKRKETFYI
jgi:hypothetical protein